MEDILYKIVMDPGTYVWATIGMGVPLAIKIGDRIRAGVRAEYAEQESVRDAGTISNDSAYLDTLTQESLEVAVNE